MKQLKKIFFCRWFRYGFIILSFFFVFIVYTNYQVESESQKFIYDSVEKIPFRKVTLVLGANKYLKGGYRNLFFEYRIKAAVQLYKKGKTNYFIVSGDNSSKYYNEPKMMKEELVKRGVPSCRIYCDYAGFRTFDSVIRMKKIFGIHSFIVVSQEFHNQRAIFIGRNNGMKILGFNARDVKGKSGFKTHFREYFARTKAFIDVYLWPAKPKFLGGKIKLVECS